MTPREMNKRLIEEDLNRKLEMIHFCQHQIKQREEELVALRDTLKVAKDIYIEQMSDALRMFSKQP